MAYMIDGRESVDEIKRLVMGVDHRPGVCLSIDGLASLIDRFANGELPRADLRVIAEVLEMDQVEFEGDECDQRRIATVLFQHSTPEINGELTLPRVTEIKAMLAR